MREGHTGAQARRPAAAVAAALACSRRTCALHCCVSEATSGVVDMAVQRREGLPAAAPFASLQRARASVQLGAATGLLAYPNHYTHDAAMVESLTCPVALPSSAERCGCTPLLQSS